MELFAIILLSLFFGALVLLILYYMDLLSQKEEYYKEELIGLDTILPRVFAQVTKTMTGGPATSSGYIMIGIGAFLGWFTSIIGSLYLNSHSESYLFHSVFFLAAFYFGYEPLKDIFGRSSAFINDLMGYESAFFYGFGVLSVATHFAAWGVHSGNENTVSFLWVLLNSAGAIGVVIYKIRKNNRVSGSTDEGEAVYTPDDSAPVDDIEPPDDTQF